MRSINWKWTSILFGVFAVCLLTWRIFTYESAIFSEKYDRLSVVFDKNGQVVSPICQIVTSSVKIYEKTVIITINGKEIQGTPVTVTPDGRLIVRMADNSGVAIIRVLPTRYEDDKNDAVLLLYSGDGIIALSNFDNCENITALLEEAQGN